MDLDSELQEAVTALITSVDNYASGGTHMSLMLEWIPFLDAALCFNRVCVTCCSAIPSAWSALFNVQPRVLLVSAVSALRGPLEFDVGEASAACWTFKERVVQVHPKMLLSSSYNSVVCQYLPMYIVVASLETFETAKRWARCKVCSAANVNSMLAARPRSPDAQLAVTLSGRARLDGTSRCGA